MIRVQGIAYLFYDMESSPNSRVPFGVLASKP